VVFSEGTLDLPIWETHARDVRLRGVVGSYRDSTYLFNHPPFMGWGAAQLWGLAGRFGVDFGVLFRAPFALLDAATLALLVRALAPSPLRFVVGAAYWLSPLAILYSAQHGNTDSAIGFFALAATLAVSRGHAVGAGALVGLGLWIKLPAALAVPALCFALPTWRQRVEFVGATLAVAALSYAPALATDGGALIERVFRYGGLKVHTMSGTYVWGVQNFYPDAAQLPETWRAPFRHFVRGYDEHRTLIALVPITLVAWARRDRREVREVATTIAYGHAILFGLTNYWTFQYFAWSVPLWFLCGWRISLAVNLVATAYVYGLYTWLCGSPWLLGEWNFLGKPDWPASLIALRDTATLFFFALALGLIGRAIFDLVRSRGGGGTKLSAS